MNQPATRSHTIRLAIVLAAFALVGSVAAAGAAVVTYGAILSGANESPPTSSLGTGFTQVDIDAVAHTMHMHAEFSGLSGTTTAAHIHAATAVAGVSTAGVATTTPSFVGFPLGVSSGVFDNTLDMTLTSSYNASYITNNGGTTATAEAALFGAIAAGKAYLNVHSTTNTGGEIRGFLTPGAPTATTNTTWGRIKALYR